MADMTDLEFKDKINALEDVKALQGEELNDILRKLGSIEHLDDFDEESLAKLESVMGNLSLSNELRDSLKSKIDTRRETLKSAAAETEKPAEGKTEDKPAEKPAETDEKPAEAAPVEEQAAPTEEPAATPTPEEQKAVDFKEMNSYDLLKYHEKLQEDYNKLAQLGASQFGAGFAFTEGKAAKEFAERMAKIDGELKDIESYVLDEVNHYNLDENNAPIIKDYVDILIHGNGDYKYEKAEELEQQLAAYDKTNGLDGKLPSAEKIKENEDKWAALTESATYSFPNEFKKDAAIQLLAEQEPQTFKETLEVIRTMALTQLSLETPSGDQQEVMDRYHQKIEELSAQYLTNVNMTLNNIMASPEEKGKWLKKYLEDNKISAEEWQAIQNDPEKKKEHFKKFSKYVVSNAYVITNGVYTEKNEIYAARLARKAGMKQTPERAVEMKKQMTAKHSPVMAAVKEGVRNLAWTGAMAAALGVAGITARQGWKLAGAVKKSWNNYKQQNDGKTSIGGFFKYLKNNREEAINLARQTALFITSASFTVAMAASGTLAFGALGSLTGLGAQAATQTAAQATIMGLGKAKIAGTITAVAGVGQFLNVRHENAKTQKKLAALLQKYLPDAQDPGKGWLGIRKKTPAEKIAKDITGLIRNGDAKIMEKLAKIAPNMSDEDKKAALELVQQIKGNKGKAVAAGLGVVAGGFMASDEGQELVNSGVEKVKNLFGYGTPAADSLADGAKVGEVVGQQAGEATDTNGGGDVIVEPVTHDFTITDDKVTDMPNATYVILKNMGLMSGQDFDELRGSNTHILKSGMTSYLSKLQLTDAQQAEFQAKLDSGEFDRIADKLNSGHMIIRPGGEVVERDHGWTRASGGVSHEDGANGGAKTYPPIEDVKAPEGQPRIVPDPTKPSGFTEEAQKAIDANKKTVTMTGKTESGSWFKRIFTKKHEHTVSFQSTGNLNGDVENYAGNIAMEEYNAKHPDNPITSPEQMKQQGYNVKGTMNGHKIHVKIKDGGNTEIRTIDGVKSKIVTAADGTKVAFYDHEMNADMVGDANGTKADTKIGTIANPNGTSTTYYRDGDTKAYYSESVVDGKKTISKVELSGKDIKRILKENSR